MQHDRTRPSTCRPAAGAADIRAAIQGTLAFSDVSVLMGRRGCGLVITDWAPYLYSF